MNKLSDEIGETARHRKTLNGSFQTNRIIQVIAIATIMILVLLASFVISCRMKDSNNVDDDEDDVQMKGGEIVVDKDKRQNKSD